MSFDDENDVKEEKEKRNLTKACLINYSIKSQYLLFSLLCLDAHRNQNRCVSA